VADRERPHQTRLLVAAITFFVISLPRHFGPGQCSLSAFAANTPDKSAIAWKGNSGHIACTFACDIADTLPSGILGCT